MLLKRIILLLTVAALMAAMLVFSASPTFAVGLCDREPGLCDPPNDPPGGGGGGIDPEIDIGLGEIFSDLGLTVNLGDVISQFAQLDGEALGHDLIAPTARGEVDECPECAFEVVD